MVVYTLWRAGHNRFIGDFPNVVYSKDNLRFASTTDSCNTLSHLAEPV